MKTLEVTQENAVKAYHQADDNGKKMLTNLFGTKALNIKITDRVKDVWDAIDIVGEPRDEIKALINYGGDDKDMIAARAFAQLTIIAKALNTDETGKRWEPNWKDSNEAKYYPYFNMSSGVGFWYAISAVGSRLCYKTSDLAKYAGEQFGDLYKELFT